METNILNLRKYEVAKNVDVIQFLLISLLAVLVPFTLQKPQLLVGSVVNFALIVTAINLKGWKQVIPLILLPSIATITRGYLFGPFTIFLVYMVPFIWLGNAILVFSMKYFYVLRSRNYFVSMAVASALKAGFLFLAAFILFKLSVVPKVFLTSMGLVQLNTALIGGLAALPIKMAFDKYLNA